MLAIPGWGDLQRRFVQRAEARAAGSRLPPFCSKMELGEGRLPGLRAWGRFARSLLRTLIHRKPDVRTEVLVFTLAGEGSAGARDAYFGSLTEWLGDDRVLTVYLAAGAQATLSRGARRTPLEAYANAGDVFAAWSEGRLAKLAFLPADPDHAMLATRLARQEIASGENFMHALMRRAFERMLASLRPRVLVYPFENRAWEKSLVAAARTAHVERIIGYQHSSVTPRHLAFEISPLSGQLPLLPDRVITVGSITARWLCERAPSLANRIIVGASLRRGTADIPMPATHGLLMAISSNRDEALALVEMIRAAAPAIRVPIILRSHPTIPVGDLFARFEWPAHVRLSSGTTLAQDLAATTMVGYSSSTVVLEGMLHGRLPLFADIGDVPAADPLVGECPARSSAASGAELAVLVSEICRKTEAELETMRVVAKRYAEEYLREPGHQEVQAIVAEILAREPAA